MGDRKWSWCVSSEIISAKHEGNKDDRIMSSKDRNKRALCETASPGWKAACEQARKKMRSNLILSTSVRTYFFKNQISLKGYKIYRWLKSHFCKYHYKNIVIT